MSRRRVWLLPEDGIIDPVAVDVAVKGIRLVRLTPAERRVVADRILAGGGTAADLAARLHLSMTSARDLAGRQSPGAGS